MAQASTNPLTHSLNAALGAINNNRAVVKAAAASAYTPPPVEDHKPSATPGPASAAKP